MIIHMQSQFKSFSKGEKHYHRCPECHTDHLCDEQCSIVPDLCEWRNDKMIVAHGGYVTCDTCIDRKGMNKIVDEWGTWGVLAQMTERLNAENQCLQKELDQLRLEVATLRDQNTHMIFLSGQKARHHSIGFWICLQTYSMNGIQYFCGYHDETNTIYWQGENQPTSEVVAHVKQLYRQSHLTDTVIK